METHKAIHVVPPSSASEIRKSLGVTSEDINRALEALYGKPTKKHIAPAVSATEIRKAVGATQKDIQAPLDALIGI